MARIKAMDKKTVFIIIILLLLSLISNVMSIVNMSSLDSSFCDYDAPEFSEWNVSELVPNGTLSEEWSALNYVANWTTSDALSDYWVGNATLVFHEANASTEFSAAFVNRSRYNRSQSLIWTKVTNVSENSTYVFTGVVYAYYNYTNFSMVLFGDNETFLFDYVNVSGKTYLYNTEDHNYGQHGGKVETYDDAINYWTSDGVGTADQYGAWIKTIYNTYCGCIKSKYWSGYPMLMQEPTGWQVEKQLENATTIDSVCFGVAFWNPSDYACSNYSVHYDYINNWRLNYTLNHSANISWDSEVHPRPHMDFPVINMTAEGDDWWELIMPADFGGLSVNITNSTVSSSIRNITNNLSMESRPFCTPVIHGTVNNDTIYYYTATLTNFSDWYIAYLDVHPDIFAMDPDYFSNNYLMIYVQNCEDEGAGTDEITIGIDVDNNRQWDDNDRLIENNDCWFGWGGFTWTGSHLDGMDTYYSNVFTYCWHTDDNAPHNIHRYGRHVHYLTLIPLWTLVKSDGEYLNNSDVFGLHVSTYNCDHYSYGMCIWENWNETNCSTFFSEDNDADNRERYFNTSTTLTQECWVSVYDCWDDCSDTCFKGCSHSICDDNCYFDCMDDCMADCLLCDECMIDIPDSCLLLWGEGEIPGQPSVNSSSGHFSVNVTVDTNISFVSNNDTTGGVDINITTNITNNGDETVRNIQANITWKTCACSDWTFRLLATNISMANITWYNDSCYIIVDLGNLTSGEARSLWMTVNITECSPIIHGTLPICVNVTSDSGLGVNDIECALITWGTSQTPPVFSNENPSNGTHVSAALSSWKVTIEDQEGDLFDWAITTSPHVGNSSSNDETNGSKTCSLSDLRYSTRYTVFVNATDPIGSGDWTNETYWFVTASSPLPPSDGRDGAHDVVILVRDSEGMPIGGALVEIYEGGVLVDSGYTDAGGSYETTLDDGTYRIVVSADGYRNEYQVRVITGGITIVFGLEICSMCPPIFSGPHLNMSVLGWIVAIVLATLGFLLAYLINSKEIKRDYLCLILIPNIVLVILGLFCQPILIIIGIVCAFIQYLWAERKQ